jgi:hypothetical protein
MADDGNQKYGRRRSLSAASQQEAGGNHNNDFDQIEGEHPSTHPEAEAQNRVHQA